MKESKFEKISNSYYSYSIVKKLFVSIVYTIILTLCMFISLIINKNIPVNDILKISIALLLISCVLQIILNYSSRFLQLPYTIMESFNNEINYINIKLQNGKITMFKCILIIHIGIFSLLVYVLFI